MSGGLCVIALFGAIRKVSLFVSKQALLLSFLVSPVYAVVSPLLSIITFLSLLVLLYCLHSDSIHTGLIVQTLFTEEHCG